jgi:hypothetical protein
MRFRAADLRPHGWQPPQTLQIPDWCGCSTEYLPVPEDGLRCFETIVSASRRLHHAPCWHSNGAIPICGLHRRGEQGWHANWYDVEARASDAFDPQVHGRMRY